MPITFAHPAAAVLLVRPLQRLAVLSALVAGSLPPDYPYFLPLRISRNTTHSFESLFWFSLPAGLLTYVLFHRLIDRPFFALMPESWQRRRATARQAAAPPVWSAAVIVSVFLGALTHVVWDSFTHGGGRGADVLPWIESRLFVVSGYTVYAFNVLQHTSSLVGVTFLSWRIRRWFRAAPEEGTSPAPEFSARTRVIVVAALVALGCAAAVAVGLSRFPSRVTVGALQPFVRRVVVAGMGTLTLGVLLYSAAWQWRYGRGEP